MDTSLDITRALKVSIQGLPKHWRRPPSRPHHTWLCTLEADLQPWTQLSLEIHSGSRTLEAPRGNCDAPARGLLLIMMMQCVSLSVSERLQM